MIKKWRIIDDNLYLIKVPNYILKLNVELGKPKFIESFYSATKNSLSKNLF